MITIVDGKKIAQEIQLELLEYTNILDTPICFDIIYVGSDPVIDNFVKYKQKFGKTLGIEVTVHRLAEDISETDLLEMISVIDKKSQAMIVQLPLPGHLNKQVILDAVPSSKDVDVLGTATRELFTQEKTLFFPAVAGSIIKIMEYHDVVLSDKKIVLIGNGSLVGYPMSLWLDREGYSYEVITKETKKELKTALLLEADIIVSGAGVPYMITPDLIKQDVVLVDAGTSESGKKVVGDIHPESFEKASLATPVPGGIGPMTIAVLYQNIIQAHKQQYDR